MKLGFAKEIEFLPEFDKFENLVSKRKLFLSFFNTEVEKALHFSKSEICKLSKLNLANAFKVKICNMLNFKPLNRFNSQFFSFDFDLRLHKFLSISNLPKTYSGLKSEKYELALEMILLIGVEKQSLTLNGQEAFYKFIFNNLLNDKKDRFIEKEKESIEIIPVVEEKVKIFPYWQFIEKNRPIIEEHIKNAINVIKDTTFKTIYLVYPKNKDFDKHIDVKVAEFNQDYKIKIIPYSLRSILR